MFLARFSLPSKPIGKTGKVQNLILDNNAATQFHFALMLTTEFQCGGRAGSPDVIVWLDIKPAGVKNGQRTELWNWPDTEIHQYVSTVQ